MELDLPLYAAQRLADGTWLVRTPMGDPILPAVDVVVVLASQPAPPRARRAPPAVPRPPKISSSITRRDTNHSEGSRGDSRVAPMTDSLAGAPIAPASPSPPSPERGERSPSQEWQQHLASSWFSPSGWNERQLCGVGLFQGNSAIWLRRRYQRLPACATDTAPGGFCLEARSSIFGRPTAMRLWRPSRRRMVTGCARQMTPSLEPAYATQAPICPPHRP